jgi:signal transduction histidine kinase
VVADAGDGVPAGFVPRLFGRFEQASTGDRRNASGMGLGLYLARSLVETNRGRLDYQPREDGGARFVARLPAAASAPDTTVSRVGISTVA